MLYYVIGEEGTGKTQYLVDEANKEKENDVNNIVFINTDKDRTRISDHKVRVINAKSYNINCPCSLRGFIAGILARDYDIGKVYVDGIYAIIDLDKEKLGKLTDNLSELSEYAKADIYLSLDWSKADIPESDKATIIELSK